MGLSYIKTFDKKKLCIYCLVRNQSYLITLIPLVKI